MSNLKRNWYFIGETALHHQGDARFLQRMTEDIAALGFDAIKYHINAFPTGHLTHSHPAMSGAKKMLIKKEVWRDLIMQAHKSGLDVLALVNNTQVLDFVLELKDAVSSIELHSTGLNDGLLLEQAQAFEGQIYLGVGGSTLDEVAFAIETLNSRGPKDIVLMYGFQSYPTDYAKVNFKKMQKLTKLFDLPMGYADHTAFDDPNNALISTLALAYGVRILEKHFTPVPGEERIDFQSAIGAETVKEIQRLAPLMLTLEGDGGLGMSAEEIKYGQVGFMKKALVAKASIKKGQKITKSKVAFKRTSDSSPLQQKQFMAMIDQVAQVDIAKDELIDFSKIAPITQKD